VITAPSPAGRRLNLAMTCPPQMRQLTEAPAGKRRVRSVCRYLLETPPCRSIGIGEARFVETPRPWRAIKAQNNGRPHRLPGLGIREAGQHGPRRLTPGHATRLDWTGSAQPLRMRTRPLDAVRKL